MSPQQRIGQRVSAEGLCADVRGRHIDLRIRAPRVTPGSRRTTDAGGLEDDMDNKNLSDLTCPQQRWSIHNESGVPDRIVRSERLAVPKLVYWVAIGIALAATVAAVMAWRM